MNKILFAISSVLFFNSAAAVEEADPALAEITNFRQYSPSFASAGQPTREQLQAVADNGFERVIYIAFHQQSQRLAG